MTDYKISERAYTKMVFHAAKYPHFAVNGILLAEQNTTGNSVRIVDAIPLFHQCLYVTPMLEIAMPQIESFAEKQNLIIAGYYAASENFNENTVDKVPAIKIAEKILEHFDKACLIVLDNRLLCLAQPRPAFMLYNSNSENVVRWSKGKYTLLHTKMTLDAVSALLKRGAMRDIMDFDNYLDQPEEDWTNKFLNHDLQQIMAMY